MKGVEMIARICWREKIWTFVLASAVTVVTGCPPRVEGDYGDRIALFKKGPPSARPAGPDKPAKAYALACDIRVVSVADGSIVASATGEAASENRGALAHALAEKVKEGIFIKGETLAVVSLRNRSGTQDGRIVADELADKLTGALVDLDWFQVKERLDLRALLDEKDLGKAAIVKNDAVKKKLTHVKYIVVGAVTVTENAP